MKRLRVRIACACAAVLVLAGCGGKIRYPQYYVLEVPPPPAATEAGPRVRGTVAVRRFDTPAYLRQGRIVYRPAAAEIGFYNYHRWAEEPATTVTAAVIDLLRSSHLFTGVKPYDSRGQEDYMMSGRLEQLEEVDSEAGVRVATKLSAELVDLRTGAVVWSGDGHESSTVETRNVNSVVAEMGKVVHDSIVQMIASVDRQLQADSALRNESVRGTEATVVREPSVGRR